MIKKLLGKARVQKITKRTIFIGEHSSHIGYCSVIAFLEHGHVINMIGMAMLGFSVTSVVFAIISAKLGGDLGDEE